jgi:hypothetical protein
MDPSSAGRTWAGSQAGSPSTRAPSGSEPERLSEPDRDRPGDRPDAEDDHASVGCLDPAPRRHLLFAGLQDGSLVAIDPATNAKSGPNATIASDVDAIADTPQGLWASMFAGVAASIDPASRKVLRRVDLPSRGGGIAYGGGLVWFSMYDSALVAELDPFSGQVVGAVHTGDQPRDSVVVGQTLWIVDQGSGKLTPVRLPTV